MPLHGNLFAPGTRAELSLSFTATGSAIHLVPIVDL